MLKKYKAAIIQVQTSPVLDENLKNIEDFIVEAAKNKVKLVSLPEVLNVIHDQTASNLTEAEAKITYEFLSSLAAKHQIYIHGGSWMEPSDILEKRHNTTFMFDNKGELICKYQKIHTFDMVLSNGLVYQESKTVEGGNNIVTISTELGILGFTICYDLRFPELFRLLMLKGAHIIFNPANFLLATGKDHWEALLRARAIENSCYLIAANQVGKNSRMVAFGNSMIVDPWGSVIARAKDKPCVTIAEIDLEYLEEVRQRMQVAENRRSDVYRLEEI